MASGAVPPAGSAARSAIIETKSIKNVFIVLSRIYSLRAGIGR